MKRFNFKPRTTPVLLGRNPQVVCAIMWHSSEEGIAHKRHMRNTWASFAKQVAMFFTLLVIVAVIAYTRH